MKASDLKQPALPLRNPEDPRIVLAVDPGQTGAIAIVGQRLVAGKLERNIIAVLDVPLTSKPATKWDTIDRKGLLHLGSLIQRLGHPCMECYIEKVGAAPGQGTASMFRFGHTTGLMEALVMAVTGTLCVPITPVAWKAGVGIPAKSKKRASCELASKLYPRERELFKREKDNGRADAVLIAHYVLSRTPAPGA